MRKFLDIGELGWSLYLTAHINWLIARGHKCLVYTNKPSLFNCETEPIEGFEHWDKPADGLGRIGVSDEEVRELYPDLVGYVSYDPNLREDGLRSPNWDLLRMCIHLPLKRTKLIDGDYVAVCPRMRDDGVHGTRDLPEKFYRDLMRRISSERRVVSLGTLDGAYDIELLNPLYQNMVGKTNIQDMVDFLSSASYVIGGTSAPPKISLLQGVPTFIIGHEKHRFQIQDNWSCTPCGFYEIGKDEYSDIELTNSIYAEIDEFLSTDFRGDK